MLKQGLQQKLLQKLSPIQIQIIKMLEIPAAQLEQRIKEEMEVNPVLEYEEEKTRDEYSDDPEDNEREKEELSIDEYIKDDFIPSYKLYSNNYSKDVKNDEIPFSTGTSFHEHLVAQLGLIILNDREKIIAEYLVGNIDEDGYLRREIDEIVDDIAFNQGLDVEEREVVKVLKTVQDFDPPGVGARNLRECLLLQIAKKDRSIPAIEMAYRILNNHFSSFSRKHFDKITKRLHINNTELKEAIDEILKFNPKPGSSYSNPLSKTVQHIIPDFILEEDENERFNLMLNNRNLPELRISRTYSSMLDEYQSNKKNRTNEQKEAVLFVKQKLDSAKWFIDAIKQRQDTMMTVMGAILEYQHEYLIDGDEAKLKPMILKDISDITGLDISTISRVSNNKYIQTQFGILPLKHFFSEKMQSDTGEEVSTREIKKIVTDSILNEDKLNPLTDEELVQILKQKSFTIARRTIAKYREQLNIPVARLRREL